MAAHHVFPQAFIAEFNDIGINIDSRENLSWVESHYHLRFSYNYNLEWKAFFSGNPTNEGAHDLARQLAVRYGFSIWFDSGK